MTSQMVMNTYLDDEITTELLANAPIGAALVARDQFGAQLANMLRARVGGIYLWVGSTTTGLTVYYDDFSIQTCWQPLALFISYWEDE